MRGRFEDEIITELCASGTPSSAVSREVPSSPRGIDDTVTFDDWPVSAMPLGSRRTVYLYRESTHEPILLSLPAVIGRGSRATAQISGNLAISRKHAQVEQSGDTYLVTDLSSTNGTSVAGVRLTPGSKTAIRNGDTISLGSECFRFVVEVV